MLSHLLFVLQVLEEPAVNAMLDAMVESGQKYAHEHKSPVPLMYQYYKTEYLGAAHGLSGILQMMLRYGQTVFLIL